mmetsp:Transcript_1692/g.3967  ORF Transcript_1692/g.3967 Transcript_1692/m.3967 type:complete len:363 (+) Transcript_1692:81-1169(+)
MAASSSEQRLVQNADGSLRIVHAGSAGTGDSGNPDDTGAPDDAGGGDAQLAIAETRVRLRVDATPPQSCYRGAELWANYDAATRISRCKDAIERVCRSVCLQESVREPTLALLVRHCQLLGRIPRMAVALKRLVGGCLMVMSAKQGLGVPMPEMAARVGLSLSELKRSTWKVCKANGIRLAQNSSQRQALLTRIADFFQMRRQRGVVCDLASKIWAMAERGWIATGRTWAPLLAACFVLAARAYYFTVDLDSLSKFIVTTEGTLNNRIREVSKLLVSLVSFMPWGYMVTQENVHCYVIFAVEFSDLLFPAGKEFRSRSQAALPPPGSPRKRPRPKGHRDRERDDSVSEEDTVLSDMYSDDTR